MNSGAVHLGHASSLIIQALHINFNIFQFLNKVESIVKELALVFKTDKQKRHIHNYEDSKNGTVHFLEEKINCMKIITLTKQEKM